MSDKTTTGTPNIPADPAELSAWLLSRALLVPVAVSAALVDDVADPYPRADLALRYGSEIDPATGAPRASWSWPPPFSKAAPLARGVHLHWSLPDALTAGRVVDEEEEAPPSLPPGERFTPTARPEPDGDFGDAPLSPDSQNLGAEGRATGDLAMPDIPDRWLVVRASASPEGTVPAGWASTLSPRRIKAWLLHAETGEVWEVGAKLKQVQAGDQPFDPAWMTALGPGDVSFAAVYDNVRGRLAFHDPCAEDRGAIQGPLTYTVVGWYSADHKDPLYPAEIRDGEATRVPWDQERLSARLAELAWFVSPASLAKADLLPERILCHGAVLDIPWQEALPEGGDVSSSAGATSTSGTITTPTGSVTTSVSAGGASSVPTSSSSGAAEKSAAAASSESGGSTGVSGGSKSSALASPSLKASSLKASSLKASSLKASSLKSSSLKASTLAASSGSFTSQTPSSTASALAGASSKEAAAPSSSEATSGAATSSSDAPATSGGAPPLWTGPEHLAGAHWSAVFGGSVPASAADPRRPDLWRRMRFEGAWRDPAQWDVTAGAGVDEAEAVGALIQDLRAPRWHGQVADKLEERLRFQEQLLFQGLYRHALPDLDEGLEGYERLLHRTHRAGFFAQPGGVIEELAVTPVVRAPSFPLPPRHLSGWIGADGAITGAFDPYDPNALSDAPAGGSPGSIAQAPPPPPADEGPPPEPHAGDFPDWDAFRDAWIAWTRQACPLRTARRPAPRFFGPVDPVVAFSGPDRSFRFGADGAFHESGRLRCRLPSAMARSITFGLDIPRLMAGPPLLHMVFGEELCEPLPAAQGLPSLWGPLVWETLLLDPTSALLLAGNLWRSFYGDVPPETEADLADVASGALPATPFWYLWDHVQRLQMDWWRTTPLGSHLQDARRLRESYAAFHTASAAGHPEGSPIWADYEGYFVDLAARRFAEMPSPLALTPWLGGMAPVLMEWSATVEVPSSRDGAYRLEEVDYVPRGATAAGVAFTLTGRSLVSPMAVETLADRLLRRAAELDREAETADPHRLTEAEGAQLEEGRRLAGLMRDMASAFDRVDVVTSPLSGLLEALRARVDAQLPSTGAQLTLHEARLIDGFGRAVEVTFSTSGARLPALGPSLALGGGPWRGRMHLAPRVLRPARLWFRWLDARTGREASALPIDSAVCGYLLPDHMDRAVEVFDVAGRALGQLSHLRPGWTTGGLRWEPPPGAAAPVGQGPPRMDNPYLPALLQGLLDWGQADQREVEAPGSKRAHGALAAMLNAIDTTFWTVYPHRVGEDEHLALMVGQPLAVARAVIRLELDDAEAGRYGPIPDALKRSGFPVRLGSLSRKADGLLGYFVNDDYRRFYPVYTQAELAAAMGQVPKAQRLETVSHPYVVPDPTLTLRPGQTVRLTLVLHPLLQVHATAGILPQKSIGLPREHVSWALSRIRPTFRLGPVLVDPAEISLPVPGGERWAWEQQLDPGSWSRREITAIDGSATFSRGSPEAWSGWLRMLDGGGAEDS